MNKYRANVAPGLWRKVLFGGFLLMVCAAFFLSIEHGETAERERVAQTPMAGVISGRITRVGVNMFGITVNLSGTTNLTATTDADGNYQFSGLPTSGNYVVSPSFPNHFFTPANQTFNNLTADQTANFTAGEVCTTTNCAKNGKLAFVVGGGGAYNIFTMNPNGTNQTPIQTNTNADPPDFSPDGTKIAFGTNRDGNNEIYRMNADGSNPERLTNNAASDRMPYYSPDGASILFFSDRDGNNEIYKMNADGSNPLRLTNNSAADTYPAFSPNGQKIIFVTNRTGAERLFTMNADGSNPLILADVAGGGYARPSYSPDGSTIIYAYSPIPGVPEAKKIWMMNANGTNPTQVAGGGNAALDPTWSPDGIRYAYQCCNQFPKPPGTPDTTNGIHVAGWGRLTIGMNHYAPDWQPIIAPRRTASDFDGDGRSDISVFRPSDRIWYLLRSQAGFTSFQWGLSDDVLVPADYDGDLKTDIAVWRNSDANFYVFKSFDSTVLIENFGQPGDIPTGGDWDGDSKADLAVYRGGAQGAFYFRASMSNPHGFTSFFSWGTTGDKPVAGDYDGDGRTDGAVFRPSSGVWYIRQSSNGQPSGGAFGLATDTLVPADYDADGKTDLAVYRGGAWYILRSLQGFAAFQYGISTDTPAPADYDGDGRADPAVFRNGAWYVLKIQSGTTEITNFGIAGDKPIPAAYVR